MSPPDPIRRRRPGGGRKPAPYLPVLPVSVSMSLDERRRIDRAALATNRTRSAFIRRACYDAMERLTQTGVLEPRSGAGTSVPVAITRPDVWDREPVARPTITREERDRRLDIGTEHPDVVWAAYGDLTRGGTWNPAKYGGLTACVACTANIPTASVFCLNCGVEQPEAARGMD